MSECELQGACSQVYKKIFNCEKSQTASQTSLIASSIMQH